MIKINPQNIIALPQPQKYGAIAPSIRDLDSLISKQTSQKLAAQQNANPQKLIFRVDGEVIATRGENNFTTFFKSSNAVGTEEFLSDRELIAQLQQKFGDALQVERPTGSDRPRYDAIAAEAHSKTSAQSRGTDNHASVAARSAGKNLPSYDFTQSQQISTLFHTQNIAQSK